MHSNMSWVLTSPSSLLETGKGEPRKKERERQIGTEREQNKFCRGKKKKPKQEKKSNAKQNSQQNQQPEQELI